MIQTDPCIGNWDSSHSHNNHTTPISESHIVHESSIKIILKIDQYFAKLST